MRERGRQMRRVALASVCAIGLATAAVEGRGPAGVTQEKASPDDFDFFSVEITLQSRTVTADGADKGVRSRPLRYRWERSRAGGRWENAIVWLAGLEPTVGPSDAPLTLPNPFVPARIEMADDGSRLRLFDRDGRPMPSPFSSARRAIETDWLPELPELHLPEAAGSGGASGHAGSQRGLGSLVAARVEADERRTGLHARLGPPVGRVGNLDRYLDLQGDVTIEVLVEPALAVPVEINTVREGVLVSRTVREFDVETDYLTTRSIRTEQLLAGPTGDRSITEVWFDEPVFEYRSDLR